MRKIKTEAIVFFILFVLSVISTGCAISEKQPCLEKIFLSDHYSYSVVEKIPYETVNGKQVISNKTLYVLTPDNGGSQWYLITGCYRFEYLLNPPETMNHVCDVKASEDGRYLAVVSSEEGHPHLQIMNLDDVLHDRKSSSLLEISPYPGYITITGWKGNQLYFKSNMLMTHRVKEGRFKYMPPELELFSYETFALNVENDRITAVSQKIMTPVDYYGRHLVETPDDISPLIELEALEVLKDPKAIPYLEMALTLERYADHKDDIRKLIRKLKNMDN